MTSRTQFESFTDRSRRAVVLAQDEAHASNHDHIGTEHLLLGLVLEREGVAAAALDSLGVWLDAVREHINDIIGPGAPTPPPVIPFTLRAERVLEDALREASHLSDTHVGTEHVLLALTREQEGVARRVLDELGADPSQVRRQIIHLREPPHRPKVNLRDQSHDQTPPLA